MSKIQDFLNKILKSVYGKDVRQAIHDAIEQCYNERGNSIWFLPEYDSKEMAVSGLGIEHLVGVKTPDKNTVTKGDMIICNDSGILFISTVYESEDETDYYVFEALPRIGEGVDQFNGAEYFFSGGNETESGGEVTKMQNVWLMPNLDTITALYDPVYMTNLIGSKTPDENTVQTGDVLICSDGGILFVKKITLYNEQYQITAYAGENGSTDPADGAALYLGGKSVYLYAKNAGFSGTEEEFAAKLAAL